MLPPFMILGRSFASCLAIVSCKNKCTACTYSFDIVEYLLATLN